MRVPENFLHYLSAHESCTERLLFKAQGLTVRDLEISSGHDIVLIRKMVWEVQREAFRMKGFVRLKPLGRSALYGFAKPRHRIGLEVCEHLARRSPRILVLLGNSMESWSALFTGREVLSAPGSSLERSLKKLRSIFGDGKEDLEIEGLWEVYYWSQLCEGRENPKAFSRRMPRKAMASAGLGVEGNCKGSTLKDFF